MSRFFKKRSKTNRLVAEQLEPRILFSADAAGLGLAVLFSDAHSIEDEFSYTHLQAEENTRQTNTDDSEALLDGSTNQSNTITEIVFIDSTVPNLEQLHQEFQSSGEHVKIVVVNADESGLDAINSTLEQYDSISVVRFITHSDGSGIQLGSDVIDSTKLQANAELVSAWSTAFTENADVLFYGCDLAGNTQGLQFLYSFATLTSTDVAGSSDLTGHTADNGDWELETHIGDIEAQQQPSLDFMESWRGTLATILVTQHGDIVNGDTTSLSALIADNGGDGISLREALLVANAESGADIIQLSSGDYYLTIAGSDETGYVGDLDVLDDLTIVGMGPNDTSIRGATGGRIFDVFDASLELKNLAVGQGSSPDNGGAIFIEDGTLVLNDTVFDGNHADLNGGVIYAVDSTIIANSSNFYSNVSEGSGGAIYLNEDSTLTGIDLVFDANTAGVDGGALSSAGGAITLDLSEFTNNSAIDDGGAIDATGTLTLTDSSLSANTAADDGGAIKFDSFGNTLDINQTTISSNTATNGEGGGIRIVNGNAVITQSTIAFNHGDNGSALSLHFVAGTVEIGNTIIAHDLPNDLPLMVGTINSLGFNLITGANGHFTAVGDMKNATHGLAPLAYGGGTVKTHNLTSNSWAVDAGSGGFRVDGHGVEANNYNDIGAVEFVSNTPSNKVYWADNSGTSAIYRSNPDGSATQTIFLTTQNVTDIEFHDDGNNDKIYWAQHTPGETTGSVWVMDPDGSNAAEIISGGNLRIPTGITIDTVNGFLYVASDSTEDTDTNPVMPNAILKYNLDASYTFLGVLFSEFQTADTFQQFATPVDIEFMVDSTGSEYLIWTDSGSATEDDAIYIHSFDTGLTVDFSNGIDSEIKTLAVAGDKGLFYVNYVDNVTGDSIIDALIFDVAANTLTVEHTITLPNQLEGMHYDPITEELLVSNVDSGLFEAFTWELAAGAGGFVSTAQPKTLTFSSVDPVSNTTPMVLNNTMMVNEGLSTTITAADLTVTDADQAPDDITFTVVSLPPEIFVSFVSDPTQAITEFTQEDVDLGLVQIVHDGSETLTGDIALTVSDGIITNPLNIMFDVVLVNINDAPTLEEQHVLLADEGAITTINSIDLEYVDADHAPEDIQYNLVSGQPIDGYLALSSNTNIAITTFTQAQINAGLVVFVHNGDEPAPNSFDFEVTDGVIAVPLTGTFNINIIPVNDAPTLSENNPLSADEGAVTTISNTDLEYLDSDSTAADIQYTLVGAQPDDGYLALSSDTTTAITTFTQAQINANQIVFVHNGDEPAPNSFDFEVTDGIIATPLEGTFDITVNAVNDALTLSANNPLSADEGAVTMISSIELEYVDVDHAPADIQYNLVSGQPIDGYLAFGNDTTTAITTFTQAQINAGLVVFVHNGDEPTNNSFDFEVTDGVIAVPLTGTFNILVNPINDALTLSENNPLSANEGAVTTITSSDLEYLDSDTKSEDILYTLAGAQPDDGYLALSSDATTAITTFSQEQINTGQVVFVHNGDEPAPNSFNYQVTDGLIPTPLAGTFNIIINPVNDAPILENNNTVVAAEGGVTVLSSVYLLYSDTDDNPVDLIYTLKGDQPIDGYLALAANTSSPITTFTQEQINNGEVVFVHNGNETGSTSFDFILTDGNIADPLTGTVNINITPMNDGPGIVINESIELLEGGAAQLTTADLSSFDPDNDDSEIIYNIAGGPTSGTLFNTNIGPSGAIVSSFTQADLVAGYIYYVHDDSEVFSDSFDFIVSDSNGVSTTTQTFLITITPVNDNIPTLPNQNLQATEGQSSDQLTDGSTSLLDNVIDPDTGDTHTIGSVTQPTNGTLIWDLNGDFEYVHNGSETTTDSFSYTVLDSASQESTTYTVQISISAVNDAPTVYQSLSEQFVAEDSALNLNVGLNHFNDVDPGDQLSYTATLADGSALPAWLIFDANNGQLSGTPGGNERGSIDIVITAYDLSGTSSTPLLFTLTVTPTNHAPTDISLDNYSISENAAGAVVGNLSSADQDANDSISFVVDDPRFIIVNGELMLDPSQSVNFEAESSIDLNITATDAAGAQYVQTITVEVLNENDTPQAGSEPDAQSIQDGESVALDPDLFIDEDVDDLLGYSATLSNGEPLPAWLIFDPATLTFSLQNPPEEVTTLSVTVTATDSSNAVASIDFSIAAEPAPAAAEPEPIEEDSEALAPVETSVAEEEQPEQSTEESNSVPESMVNVTAEDEDDQILTAVNVEHIDLSELIKPLPRASNQQTVGSELVDLISETKAKPEQSNDSKVLLTLEQELTAQLTRGYANMADAFDKQNDLLEDNVQLSNKIIGTSVSVTTGLSIGYIIWLIRGGTLVGSMLSSLPAWRLIDPLPVLGSLGDDGDDEDESLESMVEKSEQNARPPKPDPDSDSPNTSSGSV